MSQRSIAMKRKSQREREGERRERERERRERERERKEREKRGKGERRGKDERERKSNKIVKFALDTKRDLFVLVNMEEGRSETALLYTDDDFVLLYE